MAANTKNIINNGLYIFAMMLLTACGGHKPAAPSPPQKATLTFPAQNALCTSGTVMSTNQTLIIFTWQPAAFTDSYQINIKNLLTGTTVTQTESENTATLVLLRNTPYSWFVVSKSNSVTTTVQSDTWKFYVAGFGAVSYSPFPANITAPGFDTNVTGTSVNLTWTGSDVDNDIAGYDVYFGDIATPPLLQSNVTAMFVNNVTVSANTTYYWKVITKDALGNTSDSGVFRFKVN
jgi:hypothetical protein